MSWETMSGAEWIRDRHLLNTAPFRSVMFRTITWLYTII